MFTTEQKREWSRTADHERAGRRSHGHRTWEPWEDRTVRRLREEGWTARAIAVHLGRSYTVILQRVRTLQ
jgi:hypothetical protein